jgi:hypothetical protein
MIKYCVLSCFLLISVAIYGQDLMHDCIEGKVIDFNTGEPMIGVIVKSLELNKSCRTDWDGNFLFCSNDSLDYFHLFFSYIGYKTQEITIPPKNKDSVLTIKLERDSTIDLSNISTVRIRMNNSLISNIFSLYEEGLITKGLRIYRGSPMAENNASMGIISERKENDTLLIKGFVFDNKNSEPISAKIFQVKELGPKKDYSIIQEPSHEYIVISELGVCDEKGFFSIRINREMYDNVMLIAISQAEYQTSVYYLEVEL